MAGHWAILQSEELHNLYSSPNIIRMIKSKRTGWAGHIERKGKTRTTYKMFLAKPEETTPKTREPET
jgi:hypothetical protein